MVPICRLWLRWCIAQRHVQPLQQNWCIAHPESKVDRWEGILKCRTQSLEQSEQVIHHHQALHNCTPQKQ